jgi:guanine deaminase
MSTSKHDDETFMAEALRVARAGVAAGQSPFGAAVVRNGKVVAAVHNTVKSDRDPTAHAEINAIRAACSILKSAELTGCTVYSTCEPCPMCMAALRWADVDRVVFGASIADAENAGIDQIRIGAREVAEAGDGRPIVDGGVLRAEAVALLGP